MMGASIATIAMMAVWSSSASASPAIVGTITDQNGRPIERVQIRVSPGNVEQVTTREGRFDISYLRDDTGERVKLRKRMDYEIEVFKVGYRVAVVPVAYKRGVLEVDAVTLVPETLRVDDLVVDLDVEAPTTESGGNSREGL